MTPPDTDVGKQTRRHWAPLVGVVLVAVFGVGIILYWIAEEAFFGGTPRDATEQGEGEAPGAQDVERGRVDPPADDQAPEVTPEVVNPGLDEETGVER